jgi:hypothetical protein
MAGYVSRTYSSALSPTVQVLATHLKAHAETVKGKRCVVIGAEAAYAPVKNAGAQSVACFSDCRRALTGYANAEVVVVVGDLVAADVHAAVSVIRAFARIKDAPVVLAVSAAMRLRLVSCLDGFETTMDAGGVVVLKALVEEPDPLFREATLLKYAPEDGLPVFVRQSPRGADGLGGVVWPGAIALARFLAPEMTADTRVFELGCGTGFLGLALRAAGAGHVTLTDEFVELACANAALTEEGCETPIVVRRVRWAHADDGKDDAPPPREYCWDPDVRLGALPHEPTLPVEGLKDISFDAFRREFVVGAELTPMLEGHTDLIREVKRRLESVTRRGLEAKAFIALAAAEGDKCATSKFLALAKKELKVVRIEKVPNVKEGEIEGLDLSLADGGEKVWVAELGLLAPPSTLPTTSPLPTASSAPTR